MQDVTPWPESFDVSQPVARVLVEGKEVDVESVTVSSELDSAMPERVAAGGGGVVAATGSASILRADDVAEAGFNPWGDAQQLVNASQVVVEAGYKHPQTGQVGCARQITGQVEMLSGEALNDGVELEFVDRTPTLDRDITIEPLLQVHPPLEEGGPYRGPALSPIYVTDRILRHCGFYATPPLVSGAILSAPMMGSAWPERGILVSAWAQTNPGNQPVARSPVPWGMALGNGMVTYQPDLGSRGHARLTSTLHVSFHRRKSTSSNPTTGRIELRWGSALDIIQVVTQDDGRVRVWYRNAGTYTSVAILSAADADESEAFTVLITPTGQATIYASNGATATGTAPLPSRFRSHNMDEIYVHVPGASHPIGGLQVAFSTTRNHTFKRNAHLDPNAHYYSLRAFPAQIEVNCLRLLKEQAEAELAAMWIDEYGHFRWRNRNYFRSTAPVGELTAKQNLLDIPWSVPVRSVFSRVEIEHDVASLTIRKYPNITVSAGRGQTLSNGDEEALFIEPPADQDWHQIETPQWIGGTVDYARLRRGRGSYRGGIVVDDDQNERIAYSNRLVQSWNQIGPQRWLVSSQAQGLSSDEHIEQSLRDRPDLYGKFAEQDLPLIRAKGLTEWRTQKTVGRSVGPELSPVFVHNVGPWIQPLIGGEQELQALADWLAEELTRPSVILRDLPIVPDPRIQLGDIFWLEDQSAYHIRLRVVVLGKKLTYQATGSAHEMSQTITCRIIDAERIGVRYDELETAWAGRDYDAFESAWAGQDYEALNDDPLDRS